MYKVYKEDYELARTQFTHIICGASPSDISEIIAREQAIGQLDQISTALDWFSSKQADINETIQKIKEENETT